MASQQKKLCRYWQTPERCRYGARCHFMHKDEAGRTPCHFWTLKGKCPRDPCAYSHAMPKTLEGTAALLDLTLNAPTTIDLTPREQDKEADAESITRRDLTSFSWVSHDEGVIAVPGIPDKFTSPSFPFQLTADVLDPSKDTGRLQYRLAFEPLVRAINAQSNSPKTLVRDLQVITTLNNLKKILDAGLGTVYRSFRIDAQVHGNTLFMSRWDENPLKPRADTLGRGRNFAHAVSGSVKGFEDLSNHTKVVELNIDGRRWAVQYTTDAFVYGAKDDHASETTEDDATENYATEDGALHTAVEDATATKLAKSPATIEESHATDPQHEILAGMKKLTVEQSIRVVKRGKTIPTSRLTEIRSCDSRNSNNKEYILSNLWLTGITNVYMGRYLQGGMFNSNSVAQEDWSADVKAWAEANDAKLRRFVTMVDRIREAALLRSQLTDHNSFSLVFDCTTPDRLVLYRREDGKTMLSEDTIAQSWPTDIES